MNRYLSFLCFAVVSSWSACAKQPEQNLDHTAKIDQPTRPGKGRTDAMSEEQSAAILEQATKVAQQHGLSVSGLVGVVKDHGDRWHVLFSGPMIPGRSGGEGFLVKIDK